MADKPEYFPILPPEFAALLGEFVASWAGTSGLLTMLLSDLVAGRTLGPDDDMIPSSVLIGMDTRVQFGLIKTLGLARVGKKHEKEIALLVEKLETSKKRRDFFAHAMWSVDAKGRLIANSLKTVGKVKHLRQPVSSKDMLNEILLLMTAAAGLVKFFQKHGFLSEWQEWNGRFF